MKRITSRYVSFDHCRTLLPCFDFARSRTPLARARRFALEREHLLSGQGQPNALIAFLLYVPSSLRQIWISFANYAQSVRRDFALSYGRQLADLLYLAWRLNHAPHDYYLQKLWLHPRRRDWSHFLSQREHVTLVKQLQPLLPLADFDDKLKLHDRLKAAGIPTIEVLLAAKDGEWLPGYPALLDQTLLARDLVIKPTNGTMYDGVEIWRYEAEGEVYAKPPRPKPGEREKPAEEEKLALPELLQRVRQLAQRRTYIVQPRMNNHPALEAISPRAIANFRLVTASCGGEFKVISALLRMGYDTRRFLPGTYQANIDLDTGVLGAATGCLPQWGYGKSHLDTGATVADTAIGNWPELLSIARRAHALFPWMPTIGWDIISSDEGVMVMEANAFWGANISQIDGPLLGRMGYAEAYWAAYDHLGHRPVAATSECVNAV